MLKKNLNLEKTLLYAVISSNFAGKRLFAMFYVMEHNETKLKVRPVWNMGYPNTFNVSCDMDIDDVWSFVTTLSDEQKKALEKLGIDYRFHHDVKALDRLASQIDMDKMFIGYDGEPEDGTWFTCCRIDSDIRQILPEHLHVYSLRASDTDDSQPASIEETVIVNHYGDILTDKKLMLPVELEVEDIPRDEDGNIL